MSGPYPVHYLSEHLSAYWLEACRFTEAAYRHLLIAAQNMQWANIIPTQTLSSEMNVPSIWRYMFRQNHIQWHFMNAACCFEEKPSRKTTEALEINGILPNLFSNSILYAHLVLKTHINSWFWPEHTDTYLTLWEILLSWMCISNMILCALMKIAIYKNTTVHLLHNKQTFISDIPQSSTRTSSLTKHHHGNGLVS